MSQVRICISIESSIKLLQENSVMLRRQISSGVAEILEILGIAGEVSLSITPFDEKRNHHILRVMVNDQLCQYPDQLLLQVYSYVRGVPLAPRLTLRDVLTWLNTEAKAESLAEFLSLACVEIIKIQPGPLLAEPQAVSYLQALPDPPQESELMPKTWPPDPGWLLPVLQAVLGLRLSITDKQIVAEVLQKGLSEQKSQEDLAEDLISSLRRDVVEIHVSPEYLREITTADAANEHNQFSLMREGLFYELAVRFPDFRFVTVENLKPRSFAFKINDLTTPAMVGLDREQLLVNDTHDRLALLDIDAKPATNPANASEFSIIDIKSGELATSAGLTTWNQLGFLVLSFAAILRENSSCFIHAAITREYLDQLEPALPALVKIGLNKVPVEQLTSVLRVLVSEGISIRNLRAILELLVDYDYIVTDPHKYIVFDDRLPTTREPDEAWLRDPVNMAAFVRAGLKRYITFKYSGGQNSLPVYLVDQRIESSLAAQVHQNREIDEKQRVEIVDATRKVVASRPETILAILTTIDVRPVLRNLIGLEFPRVPVLAYQELTPEVKLQPLGRISLSN